MLWDFYCPKCNKTEEHWAKRDDEINCSTCSTYMDRCPGGKKMLYFEEGRARTHWSMSNKPITSHGQHKRMMKEHGLAEAGNALPPRMKEKGITPVKEQMREMCAANKGRWI